MSAIPGLPGPCSLFWGLCLVSGYHALLTMNPSTRWLLGVATTTVAASALLSAGSAQAIINCTFGVGGAGLSACNGTEGGLTFSDFALGTGSTGWDSGDAIKIVVSPSTGDVTLQASYDAGLFLTGSGNFSFTVNAVPGLKLNTVRADSDASTGFVFTNSLSNLLSSPMTSTSGDTVGPESFNADTSMSSVVVAWDTGTSGSEANSSSLRFTTFSTSAAPAPLPILGAAAAFRLSRRLRQRLSAASRS